MQATNPRKRWVSTVVVLLLVVGGGTWYTRFKGPTEAKLQGETMGTTYTVKYVTDSGLASSRRGREAIEALIDDILKRVNAELSTWDPRSTLSVFNTTQSTEPFTATPMLLDVMQAAQIVSEASSGAFDITVGPIVNAYGFGPGKREHSVPTGDELAALYERVGFTKIHINAEESTVFKDRSDMYCDLSAIAKGYGVDVLGRAIEEEGFSNYMVEIGGEVRVRGLKPDGQPWRIAIEKPDDNQRVIQQVIEITDISVATSGDYRNFFLDESGNRTSHTIDPRNGRPIAHHLAAVTVLHEQCMYADAWATALMVLGPEEGYALAERQSLAATFLIRTSDGFEQRTTTTFVELIRDE